MALNSNNMTQHVPEQHTGGKIDSTAQAEFDNLEQAQQFYQVARQRLLNISNWGNICKVPLSTFILTDETGQPLDREAREGDFVKIDIPGLGTKAGDGFDWVCIEKIAEETTPQYQLISLQARPTANPLHQDEETAHFYTDESTSTFQIKQMGTIVTAEEHGRNEVPNTDTSSTIDNIRNTLVGWSARIGLSYPQWKSLVKGIIDNP
jgi:hypothetical protein